MLDQPRPIYFDTGYGPTLAWYHPPIGPLTDLGVVLCPPMGSELMCSYHPLRELARTIADKGIAVFRIDYHGTGDAAGYDDDPDRVQAWLATVDRSIDELRMLGCARIGLVGLRMGATLAAIVASRREDVACAVLWAPLKSGAAYTREMKLLAQTEAQSGSPNRTPVGDGEVEAGGFLLTAETVVDLAALDLGKLGPVAPRVLLIDRDDVANGKKLATALDAAYVGWSGYAKMMLAPHYATPAPDTFAKLATWLLESASHSLRTIAPGEADTQPGIELSGGVRERVIRFGPDGGMFGVLSEPTVAARRSSAIVLANTGANYHIGPNRLYVRTARQWAARGYSVLRLDLSGIGESAPRAGRASNVPYSADGIDDFELGVAEARRCTGAREVIAIGLCSGAYVAFHAGLRGATLTAQILVNPQTFYWNEGDSLDAAPAAVVGQVQAYGASARRWESWKKFLAGRAQYRALARTLALRARDLGSIWIKRAGSQFGMITLGQDLARDFRTVAERDIATLIVYSQNDAGIVYLKERAAREVARLARTGRFRIETIADADHTFTAQAAQRRLIDVMTSYLSSVT